MVTYTYCPQCRAVLDQSGEYPYCRDCNVTFYRNSKPTAGVLIVDLEAGEVLIARRAEEPYIGEYDVIGGFLNSGEHPRDGAIREVHEETGLTIELDHLLGVYMDLYIPTGEDTLNFYFVGHIVEGIEKPQDDVASLHWLPIDNLPDPIGGFPSLSKALTDLVRWYRIYAPV